MLGHPREKSEALSSRNEAISSPLRPSLCPDSPDGITLSAIGRPVWVIDGFVRIRELRAATRDCLAPSPALVGSNVYQIIMALTTGESNGQEMNRLPRPDQILLVLGSSAKSRRVVDAVAVRSVVVGRNHGLRNVIEIPDEQSLIELIRGRGGIGPQGTYHEV